MYQRTYPALPAPVLGVVKADAISAINSATATSLLADPNISAATLSPTVNITTVPGGTCSVEIGGQSFPGKYSADQTASKTCMPDITAGILNQILDLVNQSGNTQ